MILRMKNRLVVYWAGVLLALISFSCGVYSFTGRSTLSKDIKTFSVQNIVLSAPTDIPTMSQDFTEALKEYIQRNTSLKMVSSGGDIQFDGAIVDYRTDGVAAATGGDKAAMNRLTIVIEIDFTNKMQEDQNQTKDYSFYLDFPQNQTTTDAAPKLVPKILEQIILNIFNDTIARW